MLHGSGTRKLPHDKRLQSDRNGVTALRSVPLVGGVRAAISCGADMALSEFERKRFERIVGAFIEKRRPPPHVRPKLDLGFRIAGQSVELFEVRPRYDKPSEKLEHAFAKATYVKAQDAWRVFWQRADLKWHRYDPAPEVPSLEDFLALVQEDKHACFFG